MARIAAGLVGAVAGYFLSGGNPIGALQGFTIAYGLSAGLDPNKKVLGPKLADLKAPQANYGAVIPYLEGAPRLAGCFIWSSAKREIATTTTEGKGGPGVDSTIFTYEIDCGIELAINRCQALRRVWSNGKLIWSNADDASSETLLASERTTAWRDLRFYGGGPTQLPDPTYEALVGVGNAPAYRTRTHVVIEGLNLGNSGQLPILTFEVLTEATTSAAKAIFSTSVPEYAGSYLIGHGATAFDAAGFQIHVGQWDNTYSGTTVFVYNVDPAGLATYVSEYAAAANYPSARGQTDVSGIFSGAGTSLHWNEGETGTAYAYTLPGGEDLGQQQIVFTILGDVLIVGSNQFGSKKLYRFDKTAGGSPLATSAALPSYVTSIVTDGTTVWALRKSNDFIDVLDAATLTAGTPLATPLVSAPNFNDALLRDRATGKLLYMCDVQDTIYVFNGTGWDVAYEGVIYSETLSNAQVGMNDGRIFFASPETSPEGTPAGFVKIITFLTQIAIVVPTLAEVVRRLCIRTKQLEDADLDLTELETDIVRSMAVSQVSTTRSTLETLMAAYLFEWAEADVLRAVKRGGASVLTIPFEDLGVSSDGNAEPLPKKRANDMETVARISVKYANVLNDSQDGLEQADRLVTPSHAEEVVEVPLGFTPTEAKRLADANTMDQAVAILKLGPISISRKYSHLQVADPFHVADSDGSLFRVRGTRSTVGGGSNTFDLVLDDASAINSSAETDDDYFSSTLVKLLSETDLEMLDIPILRDADDALGPYAAVSAGDRWSAAQLDKSVDDVTFSKVGTFTSKTAIGTSAAALGDFAGGPGVFDETNSIEVNVGGSTLSSYTKENVIDGTAPAYVIGAEILYACTAALQSPGVYKLSSLVRGQRGTEWAIGSHATSERVVLLQLDGSGLRKVADVIGDLDATRYYRASTLGASVADSEPFIDTGVALMPFAPADLRLDLDGGTFVFRWDRRSRLASVLLGTTAPRLGEETEEYDVELTNGVTLIDAATVTSPEYTSAGDPTGYTLTVWQKSATVGRGYPAVLEL